VGWSRNPRLTGLPKGRIVSGATGTLPARERHVSPFLISLAASKESPSSAASAAFEP